MPLYLHRNLAALARVTAKEESRYVFNAVHVQDAGDGTYRVEATDGKQLAVVRGYSMDGQGFQELLCVPDRAKDVLIGREDWQQAFKLSAGKSKNGEPVLGLAMDPKRLTFASQGKVMVSSPKEGRYPNVDSALPRTPPLVSFDVEPELFANLLEAAASINLERVTILYYGKDKVVGLVGRNGTVQVFDGCIMPLAEAKP